jgi:hypothetical protein
MASNSNKTILLTGATGHQGGAVFWHLHRKFPLRVLAQDVDSREARALAGPGVELVKGDMEEIASLKRAMDGVYGVYSMQTSSNTEAEVRQGTHMVNAAVAYTILRPLFFMENWLTWKDQILNGCLEWPLKPETRLQMLAVDDIGCVRGAGV